MDYIKPQEAHPFTLINNKVLKCEETTKESQKIKHILTMIFRYWLSFFVTKEKSYLYKANHKAVTSLVINSGSINLFLSAIFINMQLENYEKMDEMLDSIVQYKNYYKNNNPKVYILLNYFFVILELAEGRTKAANKYIKIIEDINNIDDIGFYYLLLGNINYRMNNFKKSLNYYEKSYISGNRSCFLFACIYKFLFDRNKIESKSNIIIPTFNWAISQGIDIDNVIDYYEDNIIFSISKNAYVYKKIYYEYPRDWLLKTICQCLISNNDYSINAYSYYKKAESKQLEIENLSSHLVKTAFKNKTEDISRYSLTKYLQNEKIDIEIKGYVYHLLLTNKKYEDIVILNSGDILEFSFYCYENKIGGRYINSIYKFLIEYANTYKIPNNYTKKIEELLFENMFTYQITAHNPKVKYVWIIEKEKRDPVCYHFPDGTGIIKASGDAFSYVCFSEGMRNIVECKLSILRMVEKADIDLYFYYYRKGKITDELIIALSKHIFSLEKFNYELANEYTNILERALNISIISKNFKMHVSAALGNILYSQNLCYKAMQYYNRIDESYLNDKFISRMLEIFIDTEEYSKAVMLITKKYLCIPDKLMFKAVRRIANNKDFCPQIANIAYELLIKSWYDKILLDIVLKYYKGTQKDWQELSKVLTILSAPQENIDAIILKNSIWAHSLDKGTQMVFVRMYENSPENELIGMFTYYCIYEIIINGVKPEYETIEVLEKIFAKYNDKILGYGLSYVYLQHNITTLNSDEIIKKSLIFMQSDGILFTIFKNCKDKKISSPYILKNTPFIYRSVPNKDVYVYYKFDQNEEFKRKKMKYFRFGIYLSKVIHFYSEKLIYYFCEQLPTGSIVTKEYTITNNNIFIADQNNNLVGLPKTSSELSDIQYFAINNALIYESMFKYEQVEEIITHSLKDILKVRGKLL